MAEGDQYGTTLRDGLPTVSPVLNQPSSVNVSFVASGLFQYLEHFVIKQELKYLNISYVDKHLIHGILNSSQNL